MASIYNASTTAASNVTTPAGTGIQGTNNVSNFDGAIRESYADVKGWVLDAAGKNTVGGTADAITVTPSQGNPTAIEDGMMFGFVAGSDTTSTTATMNFGSTGAKVIKKTVAGAETAIAIGDIQSGAIYVMRYRSSWASGGGAWEAIPFTFSAFGGFRFLQKTEITATDASWAFDTRTKYAIVEVQGAGGGGGGAKTSGGQGGDGSGGGAGGYILVEVDVSALGASPTSAVTIGAAGTAGADTGGSGGAGGNTTYNDGTTSVTANGGSGGTSQANNSLIQQANTSGGSASGGDINAAGEPGQGGISYGDDIASINKSRGGNGGSSKFGGGGLGGRCQSNSGATDAGGAAGGYGAGGGGAADAHGGGGSAGGAGGAGLVIIWEYV